MSFNSLGLSRDLLYALETRKHVQLELLNGKIKNVKILL